jgi:acyl-CoA synthetase (AMP-forming)/AMP-acid ligase II
LNLHHLLAEAAGLRGEKPFLVAGETVVSYGEALARANGLAGVLADLGIGRDDRVAVLLQNVPEVLYVWFALAHLGAVMVPVNPALVPLEVEPYLRHTRAGAVIGRANSVEIYGERLGLPVRIVVGDGEAPGAVAFTAPCRESPPKLAAPAASARDLATILQTSGTTGHAKGAQLTHDTYVLPARQFVRWMQVTPDDRFLGCLPLFHMAGQAFAVSAVAAGATLVLAPRFSGHSFWSQIQQHRITLVRHLGDMLAYLCHLPETPDEHGHTLRAVYGGGARPEVAQAFESRFGVPVVEGYGLTETNTVLCNEIGRRRPGSIGKPLAYNEVRIADGAGRPLQVREVGEIQVKRNPVMMVDYAGNTEATQAAFVDGWFRTGDLGYQDEDGYVYFVGRTKDVIRRRGENVYAGQVEEVLSKHPAIAHAAVVGTPDRFGGEEVKAYLVFRPGAQIAPEDLVEWCRPYLAEFEIPRYFELCGDLPRTSTNKINKGQLWTLGTLGAPCYDRKERLWSTAALAADGGLDAPLLPASGGRERVGEGPQL